MCELVWAAGFFDGEGTVYHRTRRSQKEWNIEVSQKDIRPLERFLNIVRHGKIISRKARGHTKAHYMYVCYKMEDREDVMNALWPYLSEPKKEQALVALGHGAQVGV